MFCPKCGTETLETHKFCKSCGTDLKLVSDALSGREDLMSQFGIDLDELKRGLADLGKKIKSEVQGSMKGHRRHTNPVLTKLDQAQSQPKPPKPKEWLAYSWQHSLRNGLISLFAGFGMGAVFYIIGHQLIASGAVQELEQTYRIHGITQLASMIWLFATVPVLKGIAQILYAAFFGESIATLSDRFIVKQALPPESSFIGNQPFEEARPPSVTEQTTNILFDSDRLKESASEM